MEQVKFSLYKNHFTKDKIDIDLETYIADIKNGKYQDLVLSARLVKSDKDQYKTIKSTAPGITGSAIMVNGSRSDSTIKEMNGLIVIDIDETVDLELVNQINADPYTFISHRSIGGDGVCVFVKINPNKFKESFNELGQYYWDKFNLTIDPACKNPSRFRYASYDPYLFHNEKSKKFTAKAKPKKESKIESFCFVQDDFSNLIDQINSKAIDLCQDDYNRFVSIGFAIAENFGAAGLDYFKAICQHGTKYEPQKIEKQYSKFCRGGSGITIASFYHYCKEEGLELYSEKTKDIIQRVGISKSQGETTVQSVKKSLLSINNIEATVEDEKLISFLIESKTDFSKTFDDEENDTVRLEKFLISNYSPKRDDISNIVYVNEKELTDEILSSIYLSCKKYFDFNVSKSDVYDILTNSSIIRFNPVREYFKGLPNNGTGFIEQYAKLIEPYSDYNVWAVRKWLLGSLHNWLTSNEDTEMCPLVLVLVGKHGNGKTSFFRRLLPNSLQKYFGEPKIEADKDSLFELVRNLIVFIDEFGGIAGKDVKSFKAFADKNIINIRLPYSKTYSKLKRRAIICGASNDKVVLKDVTGNRRIMTINVEKVNYTDLLKFDLDSLWAEVKQEYDNNKHGWVIQSKEDIEYLNSNTSENNEVLPIEELFFSRFALEKTDSKYIRVVLNQGEMLNDITIHFSIKPTKYDIRDIMLKNKLTYKTHRINGSPKMGIELWKENESFSPPTNEKDGDIPF